MSKSSQLASTNIPTILLVVFVVLKLTGNIDWSWWWVMAPLWIPILLLAVLVTIAALIARVP